MSLGILSPRTEILQRLLQFGPKSLTDASQAAVGAALTVLILTIALVAPLVYVAFYATNYTFFQKIVVVLVSLILAVVAVGVMWVFLRGGEGLCGHGAPVTIPGKDESR